MGFKLRGGGFVVLALILGFAVTVPRPSFADSVNVSTFVESYPTGGTPCSDNAAVSASCSSSGVWPGPGGSSYEASAVANLEFGILSASIDGVGNGSANLAAYISFVVPSTYSAPNVPVTITLDASGSATGNVIVADELYFAPQGSAYLGQICSGYTGVTCTPQPLDLSITYNLTLSNLTNLYLFAQVSADTNGFVGTGSIDPEITLILPPGVDFTSQSGLFLTGTPIPAALPLFASALGGLGLLGWRRKRKAQAVA